MKISELIVELQKTLAEEGDLLVFDATTSEATVLVEDVEEEGSSYPDDWNMPKRFIRIGFSS